VPPRFQCEPPAASGSASGAAFGPVQRLGSVDSTQTAAARAAAAGAPHGAVFVAEAQTAGRGRHGHAWASPPGANLYLSLILRPPGTVAGLLPLTLAAALAVADAVAEATGLRPDIRWPNDLLLEGKKCAGILIETGSDAAGAIGAGAAVLGLGVNVNQAAFPPDLAPIATSLRLALGRECDREGLLAAILRQLYRRYHQWAAGGVPALLAAFEAASSYARGRCVRVGGSQTDGPEAFTGVTAGLDANGLLRVARDGGGIEVVASGDVRPAPESTAS
jgi:BirA family biotin operon repressor/biotin-[acetyl-CoA-carboxylase] ligase